MQPLIFLSVRSFINAVRRALTSGKRMVTLIFAVIYYGWLVFRPIGGSNAPASFNNTAGFATTPIVVDAVIFAVFAFMSLMLSLTLVTPRAGFRQADVDVLFATPVSPKIVMFFRMFRDYLATLISPFLLALFGGRFSFHFAKRFFIGMHADGPLAIRLAMLAWFMMALAWVCIGYGIGFFTNRSDLAADKNKKVIDTAFVVVVAGTILYLLVNIVKSPTSQTAISIAESPFIRVVFFTATAASWMVVGALRGEIAYMVLGFSVLLAVAGFGIRMAISQLPFMYDQAAVKGFGSSERRMLQRNNDIYGLSAQRARDGKFKVGRFSRWIGKKKVSGAAALIWKEVLLQSRASPLLYLFFGSVLLLMMMPVLTLERDSRRSLVTMTGLSMFFMQGIGVLMLTMNSAISGYIELLKRVDFQKPLPFRPAGTVFWEVASKCIPNVLIAGFASLVVIALRPILWQYSIASELFVIGLSLVVSATVFLVTIAFPDAGDASQRGFRGILILLGTLVCGLPGFGTLALLLSVFHLSPIVSIVPTTIVNIGVALGVSFFAGGLYDSYNPSE